MVISFSPKVNFDNVLSVLERNFKAVVKAAAKATVKAAVKLLSRLLSYIVGSTYCRL